MSQERTEQRNRVADIKLAEAIEERVLEFRRRANENPVIHRTTGFALIESKIMEELEVATALRYYIGQSDAIERMMQNSQAEEQLIAHGEDQAREIDRLNAENADLTAKVQERDRMVEGRGREIIRLRENQYFLVGQVEEQDKQVERLTSENESLRQTLARYFGDAKTVQEYEQAEDTLRDELDELKERLAIRTNTAKKSLEAAHAEVNRRAAKEEEASKEIERLRAEMQSSADDLRELMEVAYRDCPYEAQKIADRLVVALKGAE